MKAKEMIDSVSGLTWDNVTAFIRNGSPDGFSNNEIADAMELTYERVSCLTKLMYEAGALSRVQTGRTAGTTLYFLPIGK